MMASLLRPGRTCWRSEVADRFGLIVDAENYYAALAEMLPQAGHSILMLGWEFDSRTRLTRKGEGGDAEIGPLLDGLVGRRPGLSAHLLIWDSALLYAVNREFAGLVKMDWLTHPALRFRFDCCHPLGASHHQKVVVIDDRLAFVGGLDVTSQRWDTREHRADDPRRADSAHPRYPPFHDVMAVVDGEAAAALGTLCRARWRAATGETLAPSPRGPQAPFPQAPLWPSTVAAAFTDLRVGISRTSPPWDGAAGVCEVERLTLAMIASARSLIYVENQYFTSRRIAAALAVRLAQPDCPEIVVVCPGTPLSLMERSSMGVARARLVAQLAAIDQSGRLRLYTPTVGGRDVKVHAKLMVVDDRVLRVGSANLNNRSQGLDSECDVTIEADTATIRAIRHDLLAEHLGASPAQVAAAESADGGMHAAIAALSGGSHTLVPLDLAPPSAVFPIIADSKIPDPEEPLEALIWLEAAVPGAAPPLPVLHRVRALIAALAALAAAAALWPWVAPKLWHDAARPWLEALAGLHGEPAAIAAAAALFTLGGLLRVPLALLVLATALALGPWLGAVDALAGGLASASLHYLLGRALGMRRVRRLSGWKMRRVARALERHGIGGIALLRLMPIAAFAVINLMAGAARVRFRDFALGTLIGTAPLAIAISVVGDRVLAVLRTPSMVNIAVLVSATALVIAAILGVANRLGRARVRTPQEA